MNVNKCNMTDEEQQIPSDNKRFHDLWPGELIKKWIDTASYLLKLKGL